MNRHRQISKVLWLILLANILVAVIKIALGIISHITSLTADGLHAVTDSTSNIIGIIGIKLASKPADEEHPYGHDKFETIASLTIGVMLLMITFQIVAKVIQWFITPTVPTITTVSLIALVLTLIINLFVAVYEYRAGKRLSSEVLISDSIHTRSDLFISSGVLLIMIAIKLGISPLIDPILSSLIAGSVAHACFKILKSSISVLVDKTSLKQNEIKQIVQMADMEIINVHKIRSRERNDIIYIDLHLIVPPSKSVQSAHTLTHNVQEQLKEHFHKPVELIAHVEPDEWNILHQED